MKRRSWVVFSLFMIFALSTQSVFAAEKTITKEYTFTSSHANFNYAADAEIKEKGKIYRLVNTQYQEQSEKDLYVSKAYQFTGLKEKRVPLKKKFKVGGKERTLYANSANVQYSQTMETTTQTRSGETTKLQFPEEKMIAKNGSAYGAKLIGIRESKHAKAFSAQVKFTGDKDAVFYFNGKKIGKMGSSPTWPGYEKDVRAHLNLSKDANITGGSWSGGTQQERGQTVRYASFTGTQPVYDYTATYQHAEYSAVVTYDNQKQPGEKEYTVKAICTYQEKEGMSLLQKILCVGAGILLFAGLTVLVLYIIGKKKKKRAQ